MKMRCSMICSHVLGLFLLLCGPVQGQERWATDFPKLNSKTDWPWWRGPFRNGHSQATKVPAELSESKNLLWKTKVPGRGHASPVVVGNQVFLSTSDSKTQTHSVHAFDLADGHPLWNVELNRGGFPAKNHAKNTEATPTIASDGISLFVTYYHHDAVHLISLSMEGEQLWAQRIDRFLPKMYEYGYAPSPLLYKDTVIVAYEYDGPSGLVALDRKTGKEVWKTARKESISFSTPVIANLDGRDQLLITGQGMTSSYDPQNGKQLWAVPGPAIATCGTAVWDKNIVIVSGGFPESATIALDASKQGQLVWRNKEKCYEESMITVDGYVYAFTGKGILFCWRAADGKEMWKERLKGPVSASPVLVGDRIYWANESGSLYVFKANPEKYELLAENHIGNSSFASPAIAGERILIRAAEEDVNARQEYLYAFGSR